MSIHVRRSFRLKIAVMAAVICGAVIGSFGFVLWSFIDHGRRSRLDAELVSMAHEHLGFLRARERHERPAFPRAFYGEEFRDVAFLALDGEGQSLHRSPNWPGAIRPGDVPLAPAGARPAPTRPPPGDHDRIGHLLRRDPIPTGFVTIRADDRDWRVGGVGDGTVTMVVALDLARFRAELARTHGVFFIAIPLALAVAALGGWWLARRALRPVLAVTAAAETITASELSRRIPEMAQDREFARLIQVVNGMLARLERSFDQAARFSADASHELRTPLAIMQGEVESALRTVEPGGDPERALTTQLEEIHRLKALVDKLLLLSRADRGVLISRTRPVDLGAVVRRAVEDAATLCPDVTWATVIPADACVMGDEGLIERAVLNLVSNAAKYGDAGGEIGVRISPDGDDVRLEVTNSGPDIPQEDRDRIFDRFFRGDPARNRRVDGTGLGLSLAREIVRAHGGDVVLASSEHGRTTFLARLPSGG